MPSSADLVSRLRAAGVAAVVSGAGPSVLALTTSPGPGTGGVEPPAGWTVLDLEVEMQGARVSHFGA